MDCRRTAYLSLVHPTVEYGATVWDPYLKKDINRLERVQNLAARFITKDYRSREEGCVTNMLRSHEIPSLESRRKEARLGTMYKVIHAQLPALPPTRFLTPAKARRQIKKPKHLNDYIADLSSLDTLFYNHTMCFSVPSSKTEQYKH